jgi:hypothetical protein
MSYGGSFVELTERVLASGEVLKLLDIAQAEATVEDGPGQRQAAARGATVGKACHRGATLITTALE